MIGLRYRPDGRKGTAMPHSKFGWDYPPGVSDRDIDYYYGDDEDMPDQLDYDPEANEEPAHEGCDYCGDESHDVSDCPLIHAEPGAFMYEIRQVTRDELEPKGVALLRWKLATRIDTFAQQHFPFRGIGQRQHPVRNALIWLAERILP